MSRKMRKNPYGVPFLIPVAVSGLATIATAIGANIWISEDAKDNIKDLDRITKHLEDEIKLLEMGKPERTDLMVLPTSIVIEPTNRKQAFLQGAWFALLASSRATGQDQLQLLNIGKGFLQTSKNASDDIDKILAMQDAEAVYLTLNMFKQYIPSNFMQIMNQHRDPRKIQEQIDFEKQRAAETSVAQATKETATDAGDFLSQTGGILKGLLTGTKPEHLSPKDWRRYRIGIYSLLGGYLALQLTPLFVPVVEEYLATRKEKRQKRLAKKGE